MSPEPVPGKYDPPGCHIWGWMLDPELEWLYARAQEMDSIVEVGSLHGRSAFALLKACRGPVFCIDPWNDEHLLCLPSFMRSCGAFPNLEPVQGYSPAVLTENAGLVSHLELHDGFDMVFVDGNHGYDDIKGDVEAFLPYTRRLICGHDFNESAEAGYPSVAGYVKERFPGEYRVAPETSIWYVEL